MAEPVRVRRLTDQEGQRLQQIVRRGSTNTVHYRRAMMLPASAGGNRVPTIAQPTDSCKPSPAVRPTPQPRPEVLPPAVEQPPPAPEGRFTVDGDGMCPANNRTWCLRVDADSATRVPTEQPADLTITVPALSSLYFGGMSAHDLAYAGLITPHTEGAIGRLARMFRSDPEPHNSFSI